MSMQIIMSQNWNSKFRINEIQSTCFSQNTSEKEICAFSIQDPVAHPVELMHLHMHLHMRRMCNVSSYVTMLIDVISNV